MQAASSPYLPPPPQHYYQNIYHIQHLAPQDHELKRQYLTLLSPQQVIEICLTFDVHVPPYIKSTIWPPDINAAIANLQKTTANNNLPASAAVSQRDNDKISEPIMDSLRKPPDESSNAQPTSSSTETQTTERQPSDKTTEAPAQSTTSPTTTQTPDPPNPAPQHAVLTSPPVQQSPYPQQPYGYPQHPPAAYPHTPYYSSPPGYPAYPPPGYPHYPSPAPNGYPQPHPPPHVYPPMPNTMYPTPHAPQAPGHQEQPSDDLPSYEEMIHEALQESTDPEGCAPKDLFAWMAARYPVQSNFRPSASQALQKAYKRGRFEKGSNGKYRLSATWEGGNTSKRTTRRPQPQAQSQPSAMGNAQSSPFTHAPRVHHHQQAYPGQPYPYPYGGPAPPGFPGYPQVQPAGQPQLQVGPSQAAKPPTNVAEKSASTLDPTSDVDRDTYEAARNILKAINFGDLFQIPLEGNVDGRKADDVSMDQLTSLLVQAQNAVSRSAENTNATSQQGVSSPVAPPLPTLSASAGVAVAVGNASGAPTNVRAELQAQLALLAAQLTELSQENAENGVLPVGQPQPQVAQSHVVMPPPLQPQTIEQQPQQPPPSTAPPTILEPPPLMAALLPPPDTSPPESQSQLQEHEQPSISPSKSQSESHQDASFLRPPPSSQNDDIPIDPALQGLGGMVFSPTPQVTEAEKVSSSNPDSSVPPVSSVSATTSAPAMVSSPPPPLPTDPARPTASESELEQHDAALDLVVDGETDDEDMEEIA